VARLSFDYRGEIVNSTSPAQTLETSHIIRTWGTSAFVLVLLAFLFKIGASYSRSSVIAFMLLSLMALIAWRTTQQRECGRAA
jgi:hypothetical protein